MSANVALCAELPLPPPNGGQAPEWVHLLPAGEIATVDGRGPYRVPSAAGLVAASLAGNARLPLDENHATDLAAPLGQPAPARGWITSLQARGDGIWGRVDWTEAGRALVTDRAYRHISPVISHTSDGTVTAVLRASLVNRPNLRGLAALHSTGRGGSAALSRDEKRIVALLGVDPEADLKTRATIGDTSSEGYL